MKHDQIDAEPVTLAQISEQIDALSARVEYIAGFVEKIRS